MNYIILDLEWNQSSTGEEEVCKVLPFEIIEIGAIKLNSSREKVDEFNELIKPQVYHEMHNFTKKLIHLQMEQLENGKPFVEVMESFRNWWGEDYIFCTWGPLDLVELQRNIRYYDLKPIGSGPFKFLDVQKLFSIACEDRKSRKTLEYAIDFLNIEKDIPFHRALADAHYTAKVLELLDEKVLGNYSFDVFHIPASKKEEIRTIFDTGYQETYAKYISRGFDDKIKAMNDRNIVSTRCYICNKSIRKKIKWFSPNSKHYYCVSYCDKHGYMKSKIRLRKAENGMIYVVKTEKFISEDGVKSIEDKQERAKIHRREKRIARNQNHRSLN
ncbi:MAG: exonuclease domain-containing protein [Lachnospiraceae bacterium]|nr:exonuclease domain-containing protein [Lachnospiraceae bacterium]